jgi:glucose/arabinose dehydrogenase
MFLLLEVRMNRFWITLFISTVFLAGCSGGVGNSLETPVAEPTARIVVETQPNPEITSPSDLYPVNPQNTPIPTEEIVASVVEFPDPTLFAWKVVASGLSRPVDLADAGDGRIFIVEKVGQIRVLSEGTLFDEPFLDVRDLAGSSGNEQGLLGLALDPGFLQNGKFYVNYTDKSGDTNISRFTSEPGALKADPGSEVKLIFVKQPYENHNGGGLAFGHDGYLYIGLGDGGSGGDPKGNGQSLATYLGKILRIDVNVENADFGIPADNPFPTSEFPAIWAYGLRNPWRFSFDQLTGDLYIADVGQDKWEEVNFLQWPYPGGTNFGWNYREGTHEYKGTLPAGMTLVDPVWEYGHDQGCSITGGFVYRGKALPEWQGIYFLADYCNGNVWGLLRSPGGDWQSQALFNDLKTQISSFGQDSSGEIYILGFDTGEVLRLERK